MHGFLRSVSPTNLSSDINNYFQFLILYNSGKFSLQAPHINLFHVKNTSFFDFISHQDSTDQLKVAFINSVVFASYRASPSSVARAAATINVEVNTGLTF